MATIAENLQMIKDSTTAIKQSIVNRGATINGNIATWASAIGVIGTDEDSSGGRGVGEITFYDCDGTILHSYTKSEFLALSSLPNLPTRNGLTCQGWNYTLANAQSYVRDYGKLDIGATYITDDGCTRLYIRIAAEGRMDVPLYFNQSVSDGVVIDWGDGSATETLSDVDNVSCTHTYAKTGDYVISLRVVSGTLNLGHKSSSYCILGDTTIKVYPNMLQKVEIGSGVTYIDTYAFSYCQSLASVVIPDGVTSIGNRAFYYCYSLALVVIPNSVTIIDDYAFNKCYSLISVVIPNSVTSIDMYAFDGCQSLASVVIPNSVKSIEMSVFNNCRGVAFYAFPSHTEVPTLSSTSTFANIASDCEIRVPASLLDRWKAATNWATYANKIIGY